MPLTMRPTGLGAGIDKDRQDFTVFSGGWAVGPAATARVDSLWTRGVFIRRAAVGLRSGSPAMHWRFYIGIFLFLIFLMSSAILTARAQPMSVEDNAKTASRTAVMANECPRYFKLNVEQMRQWRRIAIEVGEQLSEQFDAILKAEIKRRNAEVDRAGHRVWCIQMRGQYESQGIDIEAPTRSYEEEAEAAAERMKAEAGARAKAQEEAQADAEAAAKLKTLSPREARKYILPPVRFDKPPPDGVDVTEQVAKSGAEIRKRCPDVKFEPGFDLACSRIMRFYDATGEVTKVFCTIHIVGDNVIRAAGYEPDNIRRHEIGHCNGWPPDHRGARAP
jgi:hypothetical protein